MGSTFWQIAFKTMQSTWYIFRGIKSVLLPLKGNFLSYLMTSPSFQKDQRNLFRGNKFPFTSWGFLCKTGLIKFDISIGRKIISNTFQVQENSKIASNSWNVILFLKKSKRTSKLESILRPSSVYGKHLPDFACMAVSVKWTAENERACANWLFMNWRNELYKQSKTKVSIFLYFLYQNRLHIPYYAQTHVKRTLDYP